MKIHHYLKISRQNTLVITQKIISETALLKPMQMYKQPTITIQVFTQWINMKNQNMQTIKTNKLTIAHLNINSIKNISKQLELNNLLLKNSIDILSLNETNLKSNNYLEMKQYNTIRQDNQNRKKGGIALVIKKK